MDSEKPSSRPNTARSQARRRGPVNALVGTSFQVDEALVGERATPIGHVNPLVARAGEQVVEVALELGAASCTARCAPAPN
jgi:hypothetical protein